MEVTDRGVAWQAGQVRHELSDAGWEVLRTAADALSQPGVRDENDDQVRMFLAQHMPVGALAGLTESDRQTLRGLGYGFALGSG